MTRNTVFLLNDVSNSQSHSEWAVWLGDKGHCTAMGYTSDCFGHKLLFPVSLRAILNRHKDPERRWKQDTPNVNSQGDKQVADGNLCLRQNLEWHREPAQWHQVTLLNLCLPLPAPPSAVLTLCLGRCSGGWQTQHLIPCPDTAAQELWWRSGKGGILHLDPNPNWYSPCRIPE